MRDILTGLLAVGGVVLLCCEAGSLMGQALAALGGFTLWGLAYLAYPEKHGRKEQTDGTIEETTVETVHTPKP